MPKELEELLTDFEREDSKRSLRRIIAEVPTLKADLEKAARENNLTSIRYADLNGSNGLYDYGTKTLTLNRALKPGVDGGDTDSIIALAYAAGHEASHASRGDISLAHTAQTEREVRHVHAQGPGLRDYTAVAQRHADYILNEEAKAEIGGFNAAVSATKWKEREDDMSDVLQSLARKGPGGLVEGPAAVALAQFSQYVEGVQNKFGGIDYRLKGGVKTNEDGHLDPSKERDIGFMRTHFSDRGIGQDPSKDRYYRHTAVADVVRLAIKDDVRHVDIGLDMTALGVHRAGVSDKLRNADGQVANVAFEDVASAHASQHQSSWPERLASSQSPPRADASAPVEFVGGSGKRLRESSPEGSVSEDQGIKAVKPSLNPALLEQARKCLGSDENQQAIAGKKLSAHNGCLIYATAVAAQNNGLEKIEDVRIGDGAIWVSSAPRGADYGRYVCVGTMRSCAGKTEEEHLANLKQSPAASALAQGDGQPAQHLSARHSQQM